jgi:hypothetical protein
MELTKAPVESLHQNRVQNFVAQPETARLEKEVLCGDSKSVEDQTEKLKKLSQTISAVKIHEQLEKQDQEEKKNFSLNFYDSFKWFVTRVGPMATALSHSYSAINDCRFVNNFQAVTRKRVDDFSLLLSKVALTSSCVVNGFEAFRKNRLWEGISRIIEPLFILAENRVEDLGLARGIGLGISQLAEAQGGIYAEILKQRQGLPEDEKHIKARTMGEDHDVNATAFIKLAKEIFTDGFGKRRRFLTGFNMENIKAKLSAFIKEFNLLAIKELFNTGHGDITARYVKFLESSGLIHIQKLCEGDKVKDKGHTTALSGYIMVLGSILGYIDKGSKGLMYKLGGTLRNLGGMVADISIFGHPDPYFNVAALFLSVNTFMDVVQRFIPPSMRWLITPWSNISMASYNVGVGIYLNRSDMKSNQEEKIKNYDTDLALQAA